MYKNRYLLSSALALFLLAPALLAQQVQHYQGGKWMDYKQNKQPWKISKDDFGGDGAYFVWEDGAHLYRIKKTAVPNDTPPKLRTTLQEAQDKNRRVILFVQNGTLKFGYAL